MKNIKKLIIFCFSIIALKGAAFENDSIKTKKSFHTIELCIGMSPKVKKQENFETPKSYAIMVIHHQYNIGMAPSVFLNINTELQHGEDLVRENFMSQYNIPLYRQVHTKHITICSGLGILRIFKIRQKTNNLFFINGGLLFSYRYNYKKTKINSFVDENTGNVLESKNISKYHFGEDRINFGINTSSPLYLKFGINKNRILLSLTQYFFSQKYDTELNNYNRFFTTINLGIRI